MDHLAEMTAKLAFDLSQKDIEMRHHIQIWRFVLLVASVMLVNSSSYAENEKRKEQPPASASQKDPTKKRNESRFVTYSSWGKLGSEIVEFDDDLDGETDRRQSTVFDYDSKGHLASKTTEYRDNLRSKAFHKGRTQFEYDDKDHLIKETYQHYGIDGVLNSRIVSIFTYTDNRMATKTSAFEGADGKVGGTEKMFFTYSDKGNLIKEVVERDNNNDGEVDERVVSISTYDGNGLAKKTTEVTKGESNKVTHREVMNVVQTPGGGSVVETVRMDANGVVKDKEVVSQNVAAALARRPNHTWLIVAQVAVIAVLFGILVVRRHGKRRRARLSSEATS